MAASSNTENIGLCQWVSSDMPSMVDFNADNRAIDKAVTSHVSNEEIHMTQSMQTTLLDPFEIIEYYGTGTLSRTFTLSFEPRYVRVLSINKPQMILFGDTTQIYAADAYAQFTTKGLTVEKNVITVKNMPIPDNDQATILLNRNGIGYFIVAFR